MKVFMFLSNKSYDNHGIDDKYRAADRDDKYRAADITILKISLRY